MDNYLVKYENENDGDLFAVSIVDDPANGFDFIAMKALNKLELKSDQKKKILYGIVLRPNQKIYREMADGTPFNLMFDAPTIERLSQDFLKKGHQKNSTFNHDHQNWLEGTTVVENWIVMNKENDKASEIGLPVENGDWVIGMKLSDQLWNEYVETGKAKGFSIDAMIGYEKINMLATPPFHDNCQCEIVNGEVATDEGVCDYCLEQINQQKLSRENKLEKNMSVLKKLIKLFSEGEVTLANLDTDLGPLTADAFEVGNIVYDADLNPLLNAEFVAENKIYKTDDTGLIVEISDVAEENADEALPEEAMKDEEKEEVVMEDVTSEVADAVVADAEAIVAEVAKPVEEIDVEALKQQIADLTAQVENLTKQQEDVLMENVELKSKATATRLKAEVKGQNPITMKAKQLSGDSALGAIERITKKK